MEELPSFPWWRRDASVIAVLVALAAIALATTFFYTRSFHSRAQVLATDWFRQGETSLTAGRPQQAVAELRTALGYSPDDPVYRLRLAQALAATGSGDTDQAIAYLLNLWESQPGNGLYNLELARLYARKQQNRLATQYYNGAIYGAWNEDPAANRRQARLEYIQFLLDQNSRTLAQAEAITLAAGVPPNDIPSRFMAADTLFETGEFDRALEAFADLVNYDRLRASAGAGEAAFQNGNFRSASKYLTAAVDAGSQDPKLTAHLQLANQVLQADPSQRGLSSRERASRVLAAYDSVGKRLQQCALTRNQPLDVAEPTTDLQKLETQWKDGGSDAKATLQRDADTRDAVMDLALRIENSISRICGTPVSGPDWALTMLSRYGERVQQ